MTQKDIDSYLTEGIHGTRLPKQAERDYFLGTLRERVVLALKIGEVMRDKGLEELEQAMKKHPDAQLLFNGQVAQRFQKEEKKLAKKHNISYTVITDNENETDIGAVLTLDTAIDCENIFLEDLSDKKEEENLESPQKSSSTTLFSRIKDWLS
ncbi:MAG TPA: YueI family protein [Candidatus Avamphibacillus sp.]|nr:YueI family protein [Candidatus Avamphibacillus sp.]